MREATHTKFFVYIKTKKYFSRELLEIFQRWDKWYRRWFNIFFVWDAHAGFCCSIVTLVFFLTWLLFVYVYVNCRKIFRFFFVSLSGRFSVYIVIIRRRKKIIVNCFAVFFKLNFYHMWHISKFILYTKHNVVLIVDLICKLVFREAFLWLLIFKLFFF